MTGGKAPQDFVRVVKTIFALKADGAMAWAGTLLSRLAGSGNAPANAKRLAGIRGDITSRDALEYLRGVLEIVKADADLRNPDPEESHNSRLDSRRQSK